MNKNNWIRKHCRNDRLLNFISWLIRLYIFGSMDIDNVET